MGTASVARIWYLSWLATSCVSRARWQMSNVWLRQRLKYLPTVAHIQESRSPRATVLIGRLLLQPCLALLYISLAQVPSTLFKLAAIMGKL